MQSRFSVIKFSDHLWFSDFFLQKPFFNLLHTVQSRFSGIKFSDIMWFSDSFLRRPKVSLNQDCTPLLLSPGAGELCGEGVQKA